MEIRRLRSRAVLLTLAVLLSVAVPALAQQKGQWVPGQFGLNAGIVPDPGFTYQNLALNYSAGSLNNGNGNTLPGIAGTYSFWVDENIFMFVPKYKFLGGYFAPYASVSMANGSLVAEVVGTNLSGNGGGDGLADTFVEPLQLGWHLSRLDVSAGYGFFAPTGRFTAGGKDNVGSGYWGNHLNSGATAYLTKNKGTSASLFTDWEIHGSKPVAIPAGNRITPGQAFTMEWGLSQALPLDKQLHKIVQIGLVGYDQWQVSDNSGTVASLLPYYSAHALGFQTNFIVPPKRLNFFFKFYDEYSAKAHPQGRTIAFGGSWTLKVPKVKP